MSPDADRSGNAIEEVGRAEAIDLFAGSYYQSGIDDAGPYLILKPDVTDGTAPPELPTSAFFAGVSWDIERWITVGNPGGYWPNTTLSVARYRVAASS